MAAFGRVLRTLGGKNIGKCRLRAHQHPLLPPLSNQRSHKLPPTYLQSDSSNERVLGMTCAVFPVYPLLRASILDFRPRLANRCKVLPVYALMRASILDFKPKLANRCKLFPVYTLFRASILDFRPRLGNRCRGEWFRLLCRGGNDFPRPILIFVAAKKNSFACSRRGGDDLPRPILISVVAKKTCPAYCGRCCSDS